VSLIRYAVCHSLLLVNYYCRLWLSLLIVPAMCPSSPILPESKSFDCIMCKWNGKKEWKLLSAQTCQTCWPLADHTDWLRMCRYASWLLINWLILGCSLFTGHLWGLACGHCCSDWGEDWWRATARSFWKWMVNEWGLKTWHHFLRLNGPEMVNRSSGRRNRRILFPP